MKQVLIRKGEAVVEDIPVPQVEPGTILVRVDHSCISIGTEMSGVKLSGMPLWKRALQQPENAKKVIEMVATQGISKTRSVVQGKLSAGNATGYSAAGRVVEVGDGVEDYKVGDRVACAGAQCAHHAEYIRVPVNLSVKAPERISMAEASTVTLGAIAMQGVRRASPTLGESFVVIGLGILGQLTVQMLKANGCRVIGTDIDKDRIETALSLGMDTGVHPGEEVDFQQVIRLTDGLGADAVIITAATPSDEVMSTAFKMCRKKGRVVLVGDVGLNLNRADFYQKEIDFFISTSYGPGRYDNNYEEKGLDYPVSYVRWTENRNLREFLRLIEDGKVDVKPLIASTYPVEDAPKAYADLKSPDLKPMMVLLQYKQDEEKAELERVIPNPQAVAAVSGRIRLAVVGAGGFAKGMHLPNLQSMSDKYHIQAIVSRTGHNAAATAKQFSANYSTTDYDAVLKDDEVDAVLITTRHDLHAEMTLQALSAGKHVVVEKPLAMNADELAGIESFYRDNPQAPVLLTGFNRRFSPAMKRVQELTRGRSNPMVLNYRMNAGHIPLDHWVHNKEGGGRNIGEACHIYDLFTCLTDARCVSVSASSISPATGHYSNSDNFIATMKFEDGSIATLTYTALGSNSHSKEQLDVYCDGKVLVMDDYKSLEIKGAGSKGISGKAVDKGQFAELESFAGACTGGGDWPIPLWQQLQAMDIAFQVEELINK